MCPAAGKKAIRRKEVQVNGSVARTDLLLQEGDVVRVVMKVGSGAVWGSTDGR
jgi:RNA-binding protein YlmH